MTLTLQPAVEFPLATLCDIINRSFKGYVAGDINFTPPILAGFLTSGGVHLTRSLVMLQDSEPAGIAMLARRGWSVRVALMGVIPDFQNQGVGRWLLAQIADAAKTAGDRTLVLEVIEQNPRAVHLYESTGYQRIRRLMGYDLPANTQNTPHSPPTALEQVDIFVAAQHIAAWEAPDLPWQCSGFSLVRGGAPNVAYRVEDCYAICSNPQAETISLLGLAVPPERQRKGEATALVAKLIAAHPGKDWHVSPICPEEYGPLFLGNGFKVNPLNQFQMELRL
jgi:ribosomal protein S18 acetylase RimI-like enzyme